MDYKISRQSEGSNQVTVSQDLIIVTCVVAAAVTVSRDLIIVSCVVAAVVPMLLCTFL